MHFFEKLDPSIATPTRFSPTVLTQAVEVAGATIRFEVCGHGDRTLVLLHGHQANQTWWYRVAPLLEQDWRVVRFDFSGHGDSGHRDGYEGQVWAEEVHAVMAASETAEAVLVGHSMGGRIALAAAAAQPGRIRGIIAMDSALRSSAPFPQMGWYPDRRPRVRATRAEALGRFRLAPDQPSPGEEILLAIAESSIREEAGGWTWKYDQRGLPGVTKQLVEDQLAALEVPLRYVYAEHSPIAGEEAVELLRTSMPPGRLEIVEMSGVHHHLILDAPERCARLIDSLASEIVG